jgi:hypothetical protein
MVDRRVIVGSGKWEENSVGGSEPSGGSKLDGNSESKENSEPSEGSKLDGNSESKESSEHWIIQSCKGV